MNYRHIEPTPKQVEVLRSFAARHGQRWKSRLLDIWLAGREDREPDGPALRQMRNLFGPTWLRAFRFDH